MELKEEIMPGFWGAAGADWTCLESPHSTHPDSLWGCIFKLEQQSIKNYN